MTDPSKTGTTAEVHVVSGVAGAARLVDYMKARLIAVPVTEIGDLITTGRVTIVPREPGQVGGPVRATGRTIDLVRDGDAIQVDVAALHALEDSSRWNPPWECAVSVLHEDADLLVVAKPAAMHVHPLGDKRGRTLVNALVHRAGARSGEPWGLWRAHVVQRLDYGVSGVLVVAKNAEAKADLVRAQKRGELSRTYVAMVLGVVREDAGVIDAPVGRHLVVRGRRSVVETTDGGRRAVTRWKILARHRDRSLVELEPETGRTHQLRVHLASIGHPIVRDALYANAWAVASGTVEAIALHATRVRLRHPRSGDDLDFRLPPPPDFGDDDASGSPGGAP